MLSVAEQLFKDYNTTFWSTLLLSGLVATIAPNLVLWVLEKMFSLEMVKNDIFIWRASQVHPYPGSRIGPGCMFSLNP